jgi:serine/threonine protein kinase
MGTVWSAYDEFLQRPVAVKGVRLPPGLPAAQVDALRERTLREARAIAVLSHPNVITLHDVVRDDGEPYVVMELLPARSLAGILRTDGPLPEQQAMAVADSLAAALEAAHNAGITHRDVKPGNLLLPERTAVVGERAHVRAHRPLAMGARQFLGRRLGVRQGDVRGGHEAGAVGAELTDPAVVGPGVGLTQLRVLEFGFPQQPDGRVEDGGVDAFGVGIVPGRDVENASGR